MMVVPRSSKRLALTPGSSAGTTKAETPWAPSSGVPVRAKTMMALIWSENVIEVFSPFKM